MKKIFNLLLILIIVASCTKEEKEGNTISITGFIKVFDQYGVELDQKDGVKVEIPNIEKSTKTQPNGKYELTNLSAVTSYRVVFSKENFGETFLYTDKYVGNAKPAVMNDIWILELPTASFSKPDIRYRNDTILVKVNIAYIPSYYICGVYVSNSADVSNTKYHYYSEQPVNSTADLKILLNNNTYTTGTTLYVAVYLYNNKSYTVWDPENKMYVRIGGKKVADSNVKKE